jgi:hypothetical protein
MIDPHKPDHPALKTKIGMQLFWIILFFNLCLSILILIVLNDFGPDGDRFIIYPLVLLILINIIGYYKLVTGRFLRSYFSKNHSLSGQV